MTKRIPIRQLRKELQLLRRSMPFTAEESYITLTLALDELSELRKQVKGLGKEATS